MIAYKQFKEKLDRIQRQKAKRRMQLLAKKPSTQKKREKGRLLQWSNKKIQDKAKKVVRKFAMQKAAGKDKDISNLTDAEKERLEIKTDKLMKGGKYKALVKKKEKVVKAKHREDMKKAKEKKKEE
jgi:hypothetical protein